jgi:folate-binding protein YgfZ
LDRRTPLDALHAAAGVRWMQADGWRVPADYGDPQAEYDALRHGAGALDLSLRGKLRIVGPDRVAFLNAMLSNDVASLQPGAGCNAAKLSVQGKMEAGMHVLCLPDALWCDVDPGPASAVHAALVRHLILEDARIEDTTDAWGLVAVQGPGAGAALAAVGVETATLTAHLQHASRSVDGVPVRVVRCDHTGDGGFDVWAEAAAAPAVWRALVGGGGARPVGMTALDIRRIEAGIPWFGSEITGDQFPMEAGLEAGWISYTKGCYLGQETIARLRHQGHVNRQLRGLVLDGDTPPARGAAIHAGGKRVGGVTSAARSPHFGRGVALAYLHRDAAAPGTAVEVDDAGARRSARVVTLPFA